MRWRRAPGSAMDAIGPGSAAALGIGLIVHKKKAGGILHQSYICRNVFRVPRPLASATCVMPRAADIDTPSNLIAIRLAKARTVWQSAGDESTAGEPSMAPGQQTLSRSACMFSAFADTTVRHAAHAYRKPDAFF